MVETMVDVANRFFQIQVELLHLDLFFSGILVLAGAVGIKRKLTDN